MHICKIIFKDSKGGDINFLVIYDVIIYILGYDHTTPSREPIFSFNLNINTKLNIDKRGRVISDKNKLELFLKEFCDLINYNRRNLRRYYLMDKVSGTKISYNNNQITVTDKNEDYKTIYSLNFILGNGMNGILLSIGLESVNNAEWERITLI